MEGIGLAGPRGCWGVSWPRRASPTWCCRSSGGPRAAPGPSGSGAAGRRPGPSPDGRDQPRDHDRGATPERVWPWLTQMGWHRGGWYTPRWVDRLLFPADWPSAERLEPRLVRELRVGDSFPDGEPGTAELLVEQVAAPSLLVLHSTTHVPVRWRRRWGAAIDWVWTFAVEERPGGRTRLQLRTRGRTRPWWLTAGYVGAARPRRPRHGDRHAARHQAPGRATRFGGTRAGHRPRMTVHHPSGAGPWPSRGWSGLHEASEPGGGTTGLVMDPSPGCCGEVVVRAVATPVVSGGGAGLRRPARGPARSPGPGLGRGRR